MLLLRNARLVLPDRVLADDLLIADGRIAAIGNVGVGGLGGSGHRPGTEGEVLDLDGAYLIPGLIDLHGDAVEKEIQPRPGVSVPMAIALEQADRVNVANGITTPYLSLSFSGAEFGIRNDVAAAACARAIKSRPSPAADLRIHLRYEVTEASCLELLEELLADGTADLLSFMDHSPGQGQFQTTAAYAAYMQGTYQLSDAQLAELIASKQAGQATAAARMARLAGLAQERGIPLASHDDDSPARVQALAGLGVAISEFPLDLSTARAAQAEGLLTLLGAPNLVRGASTGGHLKAIDAVRAGCAGALCSDYHPPSLLAAVFQLAEQGDLPLAEAVALASAAPAKSVGLHDRGALVVGLRADLVAVRLVEDRPRVEATFCAGRLVHASRRWSGAGVAVGTGMLTAGGIPACG